MASQKTTHSPVKDIKIVSRKSNEEVSDDLAEELEASDQKIVDSNHLSATKFHKNDDVGEGIED